MLLPELREKHHRFIYDAYHINQRADKLRIRFNFVLDPDIVFTPEITIPQNRSLEQKELENFVFHLGLIEMLSYWKAACPQEIKIEAGHLTEDQIKWWHDLFIHGLGEFFYQNQVDFTPPDFFRISAAHSAESYQPLQNLPESSGDLVLVGGGKDSVVTLETLKNGPGKRNCLLLNPTKPALVTARVAGYPQPLIVERTIDPALLKLNERGYLNGHTPFSAYLAFIGVFVGVLNNFKYVIASNEYSANQGNIVFHGVNVNHQYSKSFRFEQLFREYCARYLSSNIQYFSFLRPLYELQIAQLFSQYSKYDQAFISCNVNRGESWCGTCPKCAFVYLSLFPFLDDERRKRIFGKDFFSIPKIQDRILSLVGLGEHKPFDCVGTEEESILAVALALKKYQSEDKLAPPFLLSLKSKLNLSDKRTEELLRKELIKSWNNENFLPPEYARLLKEKLKILKQ